MRYLLYSGFLVLAFGITETLDPTFPGTDIRDPTQPSIVIEDGKIYQTIPGTHQQDYFKGGYKIEKPAKIRYNVIPRPTNSIGE